MFGENKNLKNLKDINPPMPSPSLNNGEEQGWGLSYTKTNKLITALYMVTDIIDKDEPLRNKLRTLGVEIISDISCSTRVTLVNVCNKISEIMSFLDIASAINIISEMNCSILKKEFLELSQSIKESIDKMKTISKQLNLSEFFKEPVREESDPYPTSPLVRGRSKEGVFLERENSIGHYSIGHRYTTRLGVQKGSTLLKALSDKLTEARPQWSSSSYVQNFEILKQQRRNEIINIIKTIGGNATIKDIKDRAQTPQSKAVSLMSCSEKTLQRELVFMVKDNVLNKVGEKRWSRYFLISPSP